MSFEPIAIVGRGCVLPDALDPDALWRNVAEGRLSLSHVPEGRWRRSKGAAMGSPEDCVDRTWSDVGGYVRGFEEAFDPHGFRLDAEQIVALDPVFHWTLHAARQALREAESADSVERAGLVAGNLSYPTAGMARFAEHVWLSAQPKPWSRAAGTRPDARNRFSSGLPIHLAAQALGLGAGGVALDAACASSLYAVKLACDRLHDRSADVMLAGGVACADDLFIHTGFCALEAMSRTGRSRPFCRDADGLVPAEGASFAALTRLSDAVASGRRIFGVIRGIGLSNDGRAHGLLAPDEDGQERAMRQAYRFAGVHPASVSLLECHATGTQVGDAVEVRSAARVFSDAPDLPVGSVKSNLGHLITAAGTTGLLKVLGAMAAGLRPSTLGADEPIEALRETPLRALHEPEEWTGPRRAGISAFGFGGNNAHLVVDEWTGESSAVVDPPVPDPEPIAITATAVRAGNGKDTRDFLRSLFSGRADREPRQTVDVALEGLRFPPADLRQALPQQSLLLEVAREAAEGISLPRERTMVLTGMGCDPEVARYGARWRVGAHAEAAGVSLNPDVYGQVEDAFGEPLASEGVVGTMPNIVANRLNAQLDLAGPSFTVSSEEGSGIEALRLAARALRHGEADAALVGAVDLSHEPVHQEALAALGESKSPGDAAVVLILKRLSDARRDGDPVFAVLDDADEPAADLATGDAETTESAARFDPVDLFGSPHAAKGLLAVACAALALHRRALPRADAPAEPLVDRRTAQAAVSVLHAPAASVRLRRADSAGWVDEPTPRPHVYSGADARQALEAAESGRESREGPARLVLLAVDPAQLRDRLEAARTWLSDSGPQPDGVAFRERPLDGEIGFVFTSGASAYRGMGRELTLAFPSFVEGVTDGDTPPGVISTSVAWGRTSGPPQVLEQIVGSGLLARMHVHVTRDVLGLRPDVALGHSSGESSALTALGAWTDHYAMYEEARVSDLFTTEVVGECRAVRRAWRRAGVDGEHWASYLVEAPRERVEAAVADEPAAHLMLVNSPSSCVVGGEADSCKRVLARLAPAPALPIPYPIAAHVPELEDIRDEWRRFHLRPTTEDPGVRFYSGATGEPYTVTPETAADAVTAMFTGPVDFARLVRRAWDDGVRVFVEHGPLGHCSGWIGQTLAGREHLAVPLDAPNGRGLRRLASTVAELLAAGVPVDDAGLFDQLDAATPQPRRDGKSLSLPAHPPAVRLPEPEPAPPQRTRPAQQMPPAPTLPPILESAPEIAPESAVAAQPTVAAAIPASPTTSRQDGVATPATDIRGTAALTYLNVFTRNSDAHRRFLRVREEALSLLLRARDGRLDESPALPAASPKPSAEASSARPGLVFDRADLERLAGGKISELFGPQFADQDEYRRQTRLPQPPMLLADRVTGIDAAPGSMGKGTIWTETDVRLDSWYLDYAGRMPTGLAVEAGQADLLLISWLGVDLLNRDERVYRLLGCELTFHGPPPAAGETLSFDIHVDGHGEHAGVRLFFFHYDCRVDGELRISVRDAQAGFFTDEELADSGGVLWKPEDDPPDADRPSDSSRLRCERREFTPEQVRAFAEGRPADCFGDDWRFTRSHMRTPRIGDGRMRLLHEIPEFDPEGGPWGRGYLRAQTPIRADDWYFDGHFLNDPCMPGTLMIEGCVQAMSFYLAGLGYTVERDGWRFELAPEQSYRMLCRGQATPDSRQLVYEVFVRETTAGPEPTLVADVLVTVDGLKAFHVNRLAVRLAPDWPLTHWRQLGPPAVQTSETPQPPQAQCGLVGYREPGPVAEMDGFPLDYPSMLACALGRPSDGFGASYRHLDGPFRIARLPSPPYHFITRILSLEGSLDGTRPDFRVEAEYDVPDAAWYWDQNGRRSMPLGVLMEATLQATGWLASYSASTVAAGKGDYGDSDLRFRNLDGDTTLLREVRPGTRSLRTRARALHASRIGSTLIGSFDVETFADGELVWRMSTTFGFFPPEAFEQQFGVPASDADREQIAAPGDFHADLTVRPAKYCSGSLRLPSPMLLMLDRVTGYWPDGGAAGLGRLRAEKDVDPDEWFFKAHFFQDPVQPGSLGNEALSQLLKFYMIEQDMGGGITRPQFEPVMLDAPLTWKYRGQVTPDNAVITTELEIKEVGGNDSGHYALAEGWLWVDGVRIYHLKNIGMRVVPGDVAGEAEAAVDRVIDLETDPWLADHCPIWVVPALPMMSTVDVVAAAAAEKVGRPVAGLRDVQLHRWLPVSAPLRLRTETTGEGDERKATLLAWRDARDPRLSRFEPAVEATVLFGDPPARPVPLEPLPDDAEPWNPYESAMLFHGPSFHYLVSARTGLGAASGILDPGRGTVPHGLLNQGVLDTAFHLVPHFEFWRWAPEAGRAQGAFPTRIVSMDLFEPLPETGLVRVEARFVGFVDGARRLPVVNLQFIADNRVLVAIRVVEVLVPVELMRSLSMTELRAFMRDREYVRGVGISSTEDDTTRLSGGDVEAFDWLPGTVARLYGLPDGARGRDHLGRVAAKDHVARRVGVHPCAVVVDEQLRTAHPAADPSQVFRLDVEEEPGGAVVRDASLPRSWHCAVSFRRACPRRGSRVRGGVFRLRTRRSPRTGAGSAPSRDARRSCRRRPRRAVPCRSGLWLRLGGRRAPRKSSKHVGTPCPRLGGFRCRGACRPCRPRYTPARCDRRSRGTAVWRE
ncbi:MAG: beta-ketoacyl synthase N-terminal-like domain-containing protein [Stackebrandtia sp.]